MSSNFWYQAFVAVSGKVGGKVLKVDVVLSSHEQEIYLTTPLNDKCIGFEFQTYRNYFVDLRQTHMALNLNCFKGRGYETYNTKEVENEYKEEAKTDEETVVAKEKQEVPVPLVTHVNNILHSIFSNA